MNSVFNKLKNVHVDSLFAENVGVYRASRLNTQEAGTYSLGRSLSSLNATEMMITVDTWDPISAATLNKIVFLKIGAGSAKSFFNSGPIPCGDSYNRNESLAVRFATSGAYYCPAISSRIFIFNH